MLLRPYQEVAVSDASAALDKHNNTIVVAPTGAGKTIMMSALIGKRHKKGKRVLVLQHRDELVEQNSIKFNKVNPYITTSIVNGTIKHWDGEAVFSMVQTMSRDANLRHRPKFDMVVIDESHHAAARTYQKIIDAVLEDNEKAEIVGFTATPNRGDGKGLKSVFNNCSHQIELTTLIREGFLVKPIAYVIDVGVQGELNEVRRLANDFDMEQVEAIMNRTIINERVVKEWLEKASDRKTVVFCSTIRHANALLNEFIANDINAKIVTGETPSNERADILHSLEFGDVQVVINVAVLTEGFDAPPVSCIVLTRPCSYKSTMVQMIGRGLRIIDQEIHPGLIKKDCIVLDFGTSILTHGALDENVNLDGAPENVNEAGPEKQCPECDFIIPANSRVCPNCGHGFEGVVKSELSDFSLTEYDLMQLSPFRWLDIFGNGSCMMATGFQGFGIVATIDDTSIAIVKAKHGKLRAVSIGARVQATSAADDFLREIEDSSAANKTKRWLSQSPSPLQVKHLKSNGVDVGPMDFSWDKYRAACWLSYLWNKNDIDTMVEGIGDE
jgi:superfamily II DNA or RNA helicase